jgi:hypothetical protein
VDRLDLDRLDNRDLEEELAGILLLVWVWPEDVPFRTERRLWGSWDWGIDSGFACA